MTCLPAAVPCGLKPLGERFSPPLRIERIAGPLLVWPALMPLYDLMLLLDPAAPSDRHDAILKEVKGLLEGGGEIVTTQEWGTRRMTFEIDHRPEADYHLFQFETEKGGALLDQVDHSLKIMDGVMRHRIVRLKDGTPPPPSPRPEGRYAEAPPIDGVPAADGAAPDGAAADSVAEAAPTSGGEAIASATADAAAPQAAPADAIEASETAPPSADPATDPTAGDAAPEVTDPAEAAPVSTDPAEAAPVETAAPDASSLPAEDTVDAGEGDEPAPAA